MPAQPSFSDRQGLNTTPEIKYRDTLPTNLRQPIFDILRRNISDSFLLELLIKLLNPYGITKLPSGAPVAVSGEDEGSDAVIAKGLFGYCEWFKVYELIENIYTQLDFHENELREEDEDIRTIQLQEDINQYFRYAAIGWKMEGGLITSRGDEPFEQTVLTAQNELASQGRNTAADRIYKAIQYLSIRPDPDLSGAISHATAAMECVFHDVTGEKKTLGEYLKEHPTLFSGPLRKALEGLWGYASNEGARHGREGIEPQREDAEFVVQIAAAATTYVNRKHPRT